MRFLIDQFDVIMKSKMFGFNSASQSLGARAGGKKLNCLLGDERLKLSDIIVLPTRV